MPNGGPGGTADLWLRILGTIEKGAETNKQVVERSVSVLEDALGTVTVATSALSEATQAVSEHTSKLEEMVLLRLELTRAMADVKELQEESKGNKVEKGDLIWKVLVGFFAIVATALGGTLVSLLVK